MNKRSHLHKKADSSASNRVLSQLQSRPNISQAKLQSDKPLTQTVTENQEFQQQKFEATKLELQAKYSTITPEGQERLTALQAKMSDSLQRRLEKASSNGSNFANIPISRPDVSSQQVLQTKLTIGEPGDKYEQEADRVAAQVVNQIHAPVSQQAGQSQPVQREEVSEEEKELQKKPMLQLRSAKVRMTAAPEVEASIKQARGGGQPLADSIREPMEQAIGADFSRVKVHTDARADQLNQSIQAKAFTTGQDVFFRQGAYEPRSRGGQELLAHELTHVVQQNGATAIHHEQTQINKLAETSTSARPMQLSKSENLLQCMPNDNVENPEQKDAELINLKIENEDLKKEIQLLEEIQRDMDELGLEYEKQIDSLQKENSQLSNEKSESEKRVEKLKENLVQLTQKSKEESQSIREARERIRELEKQNNKLQEDSQNKDLEIRKLKEENTKLTENLQKVVSNVRANAVEGSVKGSYLDAMVEVGNNLGFIIPGVITTSGLPTNDTVAKATGVTGGVLVAATGLTSAVVKLQKIHGREKKILENKSESTLIGLSGCFNLASGIAGVYSAAKETADDPQIAQAISDGTFAFGELIAMIDLGLKQLKQEKRIPWSEFFIKFLLKLGRLVGLVWEVTLLARKVSSDDPNLAIARSMSVASTILQLMLAWGDAQKIKEQKQSFAKQRRGTEEFELSTVS